MTECYKKLYSLIVDYLAEHQVLLDTQWGFFAKSFNTLSFITTCATLVWIASGWQRGNNMCMCMHGLSWTRLDLMPNSSSSGYNDAIIMDLDAHLIMWIKSYKFLVHCSCESFEMHLYMGIYGTQTSWNIKIFMERSLSINKPVHELRFHDQWYLRFSWHNYARYYDIVIPECSNNLKRASSYYNDKAISE